MHAPDSNKKPVLFEAVRPAGRVAALYALFGALWILLSDRLLAAVVTDTAVLNQLQTVKGWAFVAVTAGLLYVFTLREYQVVSHAARALQQLALIGGARDEEDFLSRMATHLAAATGQEFTLVSLLAPDGNSFRTLLLEAGKPPRHIPSYAVDGSPCGATLQRGGFLLPRQAHRAFANITALAGLKIESYVGNVIRDDQGHRLGVLSVMSRSPQRFPAVHRALLSVFANRAGSELARLRAIAQQEKLAQEVQHQFRQFATVLETMNVGEIVAEETNGRILHMNRMATDILSADALGSTISKILFDTTSFPADTPVPQDGEECFEFELPLPSNQRWYHCLAKRIHWTDGRPAYLWLLTDVHDRRELEHLRSQMLTAMSHEMRTPLTAMLGFTELMFADTPPSNPHHHYLEHIQQAGERLERLVNNFITLQRLTTAPQTPPHLRVVHLEPLLRNVVNMLRGHSPIHELELTCPAEQPVVVGMVETLQELLYQLVLNAIQFSPNGGTIRLDVTRCHTKIVLSVHDPGVGIAPEDAERIFDPFYRGTTAGQNGGLGLGLALCRKIVELHHGHIWANSSLGRGSTFHVTLPLPEVQPAATDAA